jgi:hypothetical protein
MNPNPFSKFIVILLIGLLLIVNVLPSRSPPGFRYTGSDPSRSVWNFGWPLATFIVDEKNGFHFSPLAIFYAPIDTVAMAALIFALRRSKKSRAG